jgi:uncharacterized phage infection (PIP) family protein YhgE
VAEQQNGQNGRRLPVIDPTANVLSLVEAAVKRLDDLRAADAHRLEELMTLRAMFEEKLSLKESQRIDAIRAVDVAAVAVASERADQKASVLASQVAQTAETLRSLVAETTQAQVKALEQVSSQLGDRIGLLEKSQYQISGTGKGMRDLWGWITAAVFLVLAVVGYLSKSSL